MLEFLNNSCDININFNRRNSKMKKEFLEPEVEVVEFEVAQGIAVDGEDPENPVDPNSSWGW